MRGSGRAFLWTEDDVLAYIRPATRTSTLCSVPVSSSPRAFSRHFSLRACRTRARRLPLVVSFRGASSAHLPVSRPSRASIAAAPARNVGAHRSRARNPAVCEAARRFVARSRAVGTIEPRKRARSASRRARSSSRITVARRLTPPASPLRSQTRARGGRAKLHLVGKHGRVRWRLRYDQVWSPAGGWFADPKYWKRNTMLARAFWAWRRHHLQLQPAGGAEAARARRRIPSQAWCANFPEGSPAK